MKTVINYYLCGYPLWTKETVMPAEIEQRLITLEVKLDEILREHEQVKRLGEETKRMLSATQIKSAFAHRPL